jgi:hypothetical protein
VGKREEMTQTLYAHMNKIKIKKKKSENCYPAMVVHTYNSSTQKIESRGSQI